MSKRLEGAIVQAVKAPRRDRGKGFIDIDIVEADTKHAKIWHNFVQKPYINKDRERVDFGWNWIIYSRWFRKVSTFLNQKPVLYFICTKKNDNVVPLGMVLVANNYPWIKDPTLKSSFIWYLTTAPVEFLKEHLSDSEIPHISEVTLDVGITASYHNLNKGHLGLHADLKGGEKLLNFYRRCKLQTLEKSAKLPKGRSFKGNDGRYFFYDENTAFSVSSKLDYLR